ncbi:acyl-CoA dehydrogenase [Mycobacteroides abscessus subsp. abscessus]|nr:acyl-CoA dehydrogenase [Mycobacteroides abscessus subsp. abscessus]
MNLAKVHAKVEYLKLLNWEIASRADQGGAAAPRPWDASTCKVYGTELATEAYRLLMEGLERLHRAALILTFGGGTNEVQRDIIAMTALRQPAAAR